MYVVVHPNNYYKSKDIENAYKIMANKFFKNDNIEILTVDEFSSMIRRLTEKLDVIHIKEPLIKVLFHKKLKKIDIPYKTEDILDIKVFD